LGDPRATLAGQGAEAWGSLRASAQSPRGPASGTQSPRGPASGGHMAASGTQSPRGPASGGHMAASGTPRSREARRLR